MLQGSVALTIGKEGADSSNMIYIFQTHLPLDSAYYSCTTARTEK
jgi:hypothetical protein